MQSKIMMRATAIGAVCALAGAGAGIAGSSAASSTSTSTSAKSAKTAKSTAAKRAAGFRGMGGPGHDHAVHAVETVLNKAGTAYITETEDNGTIKSVSGDEVTISEGTTAVPYKDVTVTIPSDATVERNGKTATVADLKAGDDIHVSVSSDGTDVHAHDASFTPARGGHGGPGGPGGPPPAAATTTK